MKMTENKRRRKLETERSLSPHNVGFLPVSSVWPICDCRVDFIVQKSNEAFLSAADSWWQNHAVELHRVTTYQGHSSDLSFLLRWRADCVTRLFFPDDSKDSSLTVPGLDRTLLSFPIIPNLHWPPSPSRGQHLCLFFVVLLIYLHLKFNRPGVGTVWSLPHSSNFLHVPAIFGQQRSSIAFNVGHMRFCLSGIMEANLGASISSLRSAFGPLRLRK